MTTLEQNALAAIDALRATIPQTQIRNLRITVFCSDGKDKNVFSVHGYPFPVGSEKEYSFEVANDESVAGALAKLEALIETSKSLRTKALILLQKADALESPRPEPAF